MNDKKISKIVGNHLVKCIKIGVDTIKSSEGETWSEENEKFKEADTSFEIDNVKFTTSIVRRDSMDRWSIELDVKIGVNSDPKSYAKVIHFGLSSNVVLNMNDRFFKVDKVSFANGEFDCLNIDIVEVVGMEVETLGNGLKIYKPIIPENPYGVEEK